MIAQQATLAFGHTQTQWQEFYWTNANNLTQKVVNEWCVSAHRTLYIYGEQAAGKTQLIRHLIHSAPNKRIQAIDGAVFATEDIISLDVHALCIDDIDAVAGNRAAEELLFHALNGWHDAGTHLLLTASRRPTECNWHLNDVRTRLEQSLVLMLEPLDDEALKAALIAYARCHGWYKCEQHIAYLQKRLPGNIAALFGTINRIVEHFPANTPLSQHTLAEYVDSF